MKKILLSGATGFVGSRLKENLKKDYQIFTPNRYEMNLYDKNAIYIYINKVKPDYIIHMAALSDTGYCEQNKEESFQINVAAAYEMARITKEIGAKMIFMSSDQVYNGTKQLGFLSEDVALSPVSVYGCHKLEAEEKILSLDFDSVILRATWMYDFPSTKFKNNNNLLIRLLNAVYTKEKPVSSPLFQNCNKEVIDFPISLSTREYRGITWVKEVIENLPAFLNLPAGVYNMGSENILTTYETGEHFLKVMGYETLIKEIIIKNENLYRDFPRNLNMSINKIRNFGISFSDTREGIKKCIKEMKK